MAFDVPARLIAFGTSLPGITAYSAVGPAALIAAFEAHIDLAVLLVFSAARALLVLNVVSHDDAFLSGLAHA